MLGMTLGLC